MSVAEIDAKLMARAIELARQGDPSPNPPVGAVVARGGEILAEGHHRAAGEDHAEVVALRAAAEGAEGATLYATLEPCNHEGRTPPCTDEILGAKVRRVVIGCRDPNPNVTGGGIERLRDAGVEVVSGVLEDECRDLVRPWSKFITTGTPFLSLKLAVSLDGRIATRSGVSKWITCDESRRRVHSLRAEHDAVLVGITTVLADDPHLTVRDVAGRNPVRCVMDSKLRIPLDSQLVTSAQDAGTCVITTEDASRAIEESLVEAGVKVLRVAATAEGRVDVMAALRELAAREIVSVLCEGGAELAGTLLAAGLPDQMNVFVAPILLGPRGRPGAVDWAGPESPTEAPRIASPRWELCGSDAFVTGQLVYPKRSKG